MTLSHEPDGSPACWTDTPPWRERRLVEPAGIDRADRWGIFVTTWPATWFGLGRALADYERSTITA